MNRFFARFDEKTRDCVGQTTIPISEEPPTLKPGLIRVQIPEKLPKVSDYMLDNNGNVVEKSEFPTFNKDVIIADGVDEAIMVGIPKGTKVWMLTVAGEQTGEVNDGKLEISCDIPSIIHISLEAPRYKYVEMELEAK